MTATHRRGRDVALRIKDEIRRDNLSLVSAGVAFYGLLALAPGLAAVVSIYGLVSTPADVRRQVGTLSAAVPAEARHVVDELLTQAVTANSSTKGIGVVVGLVLALWSASAAMRHLIEALSAMYDKDERRGYVTLRLRALLLTAGAVVFLLVVLGLLAVVPVMADRVDAVATAATILRWPLLVALMMAALSVLYRWAPARHEPRWRWFSWGATIGTVLWLAGSVAFSFYAGNFGNYTKIYGSMAAVVVTMVWLWITSFCVLLGAEINAELEHRAPARDATGVSAPG
jgi:membrane protein